MLPIHGYPLIYKCHNFEYVRFPSACLMVITGYKIAILLFLHCHKPFANSTRLK